MSWKVGRWSDGASKNGSLVHFSEVEEERIFYISRINHFPLQLPANTSYEFFPYVKAKTKSFQSLIFGSQIVTDYCATESHYSGNECSLVNSSDALIVWVGGGLSLAPQIGDAGTENSNNSSGDKQLGNGKIGLLAPESAPFTT